MDTQIEAANAKIIHHSFLHMRVRKPKWVREREREKVRKGRRYVIEQQPPTNTSKTEKKSERWTVCSCGCVGVWVCVFGWVCVCRCVGVWVCERECVCVRKREKNKNKEIMQMMNILPSCFAPYVHLHFPNLSIKMKYNFSHRLTFD